MTWGHLVIAETALEGGAFGLRAVDPAADAGLVHGWMNDPEVAEYWELAQPEERVAAYLREQVASAHSTPYIGCVDGTAMSYWELYRADLDPLRHHYPARPRDAGVHMLLGPSAYRGKGLGAVLLRAVSDWQLRTDPYAGRVVAEPDVRNVRSVRAFEQAGFRVTGQIELPVKRAVFMVRERAA
ncbi:GNAT family N-acetyltransferase [Streptomyces sp. TRM49041]|uniref:GNAT family N-acetyltransferase n=1 Tax=Streptomyces sp. TRM49041 TaxID=2603216 RepID=UPI0011EBA64F|nr:GNAT family N-acetyltransferase [Streptomyces sp. TRM49041]